jgi:hypothetical protein
MTQFTEKAEYLDGNSKVRIVLDGGLGSALVQNAAGNITTHLRPGSIIIGPESKGSLPLSGLQVAVNPNLPTPKPTSSLTVGGLGSEGDVRVLNEAGEITVHIDGNTGDVELLGADCAEEFEVDPSQAPEPGMVMVITENTRLQPCAQAYDRKVAGVLSGAGAYRPGIVLGRSYTVGHRVPLALTGRAYCKVDAQYGPIEIGDLLTTSATLGHAMKAADPIQAFGAVIGKALSSVPSGQSLIPILIALQ